ncbi:MAG: 30S ribosomal protein S13 [Candidatus Organicella extenuata]|jgi:small subunit ribosomal protein S13|uniref:Small ribosomal subunit protein uS13 n=1 Tax=Candidatus Organicella extenuata TaxID=2841811 RepID=A0AA51BKK8_9BACT|nr:MAG: 30S ribosomal protein S13 [Candidatus Organicella extenuata]
MIRILGVNIPDDKQIFFSMKYVYGLGNHTIKRILKESNIGLSRKTNTLTESEVSSLTRSTNSLNLSIEGDLRRKVYNNIKRLIFIKSYRGVRHFKNLPVRGQRTKTNSKTRKRRRVGIKLNK